jgi:hypothetical protein
MLVYQREQYIQALSRGQRFTEFPVGFVGFGRRTEYLFDL